MKYNILGATGLRVSELCLGTMTFGGRGFWTSIGTLDQNTVDLIVKRSIDAGINFIDTANVYSLGMAEEITGRAIRNLGLNREELVIATKVRGTIRNLPNGSGLSRKHILREIDDSLRRLGMDYVDLYQIHGFDAVTPLEESLEALDQVVKSGKVRYIGCSNLAAWQIMKALDYSKFMHIERFISLQAYYTIAGRDLEYEIIPLLLDQNVGLMVWSPLAGGFLSGKFKRTGDVVEGARRQNFDFPPLNKEKAYLILEELEKMAAEKNATVASLALAWLLRRPAVTSVIIGIKNISQLEENLNSVNIEFSDEELKRLDEVSRPQPQYPGWMIKRQNADSR